MSHERNLEYLERRQIIYRTIPQDKPTTQYEWGLYYEEGTYQCYDLFRSKAKITTYRSLKWHLLVLWYLNPGLNPDDFSTLADVISYRPNGFITFNIPKELLKQIVYEVSMYDLEEPPKNRLRKIIFDPTCGLNVEEKMKIVGELVGRTKKIQQDDIYDSMLHIHDKFEKITISKLSKLLECSPRTIYRNIGEELKREKELLNIQLNTNEEI
ncbi:MAG: hypothetical protein GY777_00155 [Candidatus Brocadiaceae bacterium]|nr:hypothetical protein [Candidatus Brocadiaceae bacterium]